MVKINKRNFSFRGSLTPISKSKVTRIVQHHMAHKSWGIDDVHSYHKNGNGWAGIGYNYWVDFKGNVYEGRGMNVGAHVAGYNSTSIGVGFQGDFTTQTMPDAQLKAGIAINKWIMSQLPNKVSIVGHKDLASTSCPGQNFRMSELRKGISGGSVSTSKTSKPTSKPATSGGSVVDYLNAKGINSSFANRKNLAAKHGISNYKGTASQNVELLNKVKGGKPAPKPTSSKSIKQMADEINRGLHGNGHANRRRSLGISNSRYQEVRNYINKGGTTSPSKSVKSVNQMAKEVIDGKHGTGHSNRQRSLGVSSSVYDKVRSRVNKLM